MGNIEDFRRQLAEALAQKRQAIQNETIAESLAAKQKEQERSEAETRRREVVGTRNQKVLELETELSVNDYLEALREEITPKSKIERWGPHNGEVGYALVYKRQKKNVSLGQSITPSGKLYYPPTETYGKRVVENVLGVVMTHESKLVVLNSICADAPDMNKDINPLTWNWKKKIEHWDWDITRNFKWDISKMSRYPGIRAYGANSGLDEKGLVIFNLGFREATKGNLTRGLSEFYAELKAGNPG